MPTLLKLLLSTGILTHDDSRLQKPLAFKPPLLQWNSGVKKITKTIHFLVWKITRSKYNNPKVLPKRLWEFNNLEEKFFCTILLPYVHVAHNIIFFFGRKTSCVWFCTVYTHMYLYVHVMMFSFLGDCFHRNGYHTSRPCLAICVTIQDTVFTWK